MTIRIVRDDVLRTLRASVEENLDRYRSGDFSYLSLDASQIHEIAVTPIQPLPSDLKIPDGSSDYEVENCEAVYKYLAGLTPYDARDERLWVYLSHTTFLDYARARWPIPADDTKAAAHIRLHFFASANRQIERDHAVSRLWWMSHLCRRVPDFSPEETLAALLHKSDVRANILERPTVAQSVNVFTAIIRKLKLSMDGGKSLFERQPFRRLMVELNSIGGFKLLDCMEQVELDSLLNEIIQEKLELATL